MDRKESAGNSSSEVTVEMLLRGVLTLEQSQAKKVFTNLQKGLENLVRSKEISSSLAREFRKIKAGVLKKKEGEKMKMINTVKEALEGRPDEGKAQSEKTAKLFFLHRYLDTNEETLPIQEILEGIRIDPYKIMTVLFNWGNSHYPALLTTLIGRSRFPRGDREVIRDAFLEKMGEDVHMIFICEQLNVKCPWDTKKIQKLVDRHCVKWGVREIHGLKMSSEAKTSERMIAVFQEWIPYPSYRVETLTEWDEKPETTSEAKVTVLKEGERCEVHSGWNNALTGQPDSRKFVIVNEGGNAARYDPEDLMTTTQKVKEAINMLLYATIPHNSWQWRFDEGAANEAVATLQEFPKETREVINTFLRAKEMIPEVVRVLKEKGGLRELEEKVLTILG